MKSFSLFKQLLVGFLISLFASISIYSISLLLGYTDALNLSIAAASLFYITFILSNSHLKTGRVVVFSLALLGAFTLCFLVSPNQLIIATSLLSIFVVRVIFYQSSWRASAFDAGLIGLGFFIASGVLVSTSSWFLSFWCFFFIQSFIVYQSDIFSSSPTENNPQQQLNTQKFCQAKNMAEQAINQLSNKMSNQMQNNH